MTVSITNNKPWMTASGTLDEVTAYLAAQKVPRHHVVGFTHDGTNYVVLYSLLD